MSAGFGNESLVIICLVKGVCLCKYITLGGKLDCDVINMVCHVTGVVQCARNLWRIIVD